MFILALAKSRIQNHSLNSQTMSWGLASHDVGSLRLIRNIWVTVKDKLASKAIPYICKLPHMV